jgi:pimeloyl-ACP methyl ester carboxylesterase
MSHSHEDPRRRLMAEIPATEYEVLLADVSTAVLVGGDGPPLVLLHGPGASAVHLVRLLPQLMASHRVIAPDLPGQGSSEVLDGPLDSGRVLTWLDELIQGTCPSPPTLVGDSLGGAIAARYATERGERLDRLVLADSLGLAPFEPTPDFGAALRAFMAQPDLSTHDRLWRQCALDFDALRERMGELWPPFEQYNLDLAQTPGILAALTGLMEQFVFAPIPAAELARIEVPTTLIWGRDDRATSLAVAEEASARYGWPLHVIEQCGDDPLFEQPEAFLDALKTALDASAEAAA